MGASGYALRSLLNNKTAVAVPIFQAPGANAIQLSDDVRHTMDELKKNFPEGIDYAVVYDPTVFVRNSIKAVVTTLFEAVLLVVIVVILFLQTWRASIIPLAAVPVSLVGTFAVMHAFGFSINALSLFGLVLAIGIVVDDAIVVVENVERNIALGLSPVEATQRAMSEVTGPIIATALGLCAVFIPTAFISGLTGQFYKPFAITIAISTVISAFNSLTLSPALSAVLLKDHHAPKDWLGRVMDSLLGWFFRPFNRFFEWAGNKYGKGVDAVIRKSVIALLLYAGLVGLTAWGFNKVPTGFVPTQDKQYLVAFAQLPDAASLDRTDEVIRKMSDVGLKQPGVQDAVAFPGLSISGFKLFVEDRADLGYDALFQNTQALIGQGYQNPGLGGLFSTFTVNVPQLDADIDRVKAKSQGVPLQNLFETLQIYLGSLYVNDFNRFGRTFQVAAQYESFRLPLAIILIVPLCLLFAIIGVWLSGGDNNIFTQIGLIVLVGLACKNAILIVEFAKAKQDEGMPPLQAALEAARLRLRPILMTSIAFIAGVFPLVVSTGAGSEMRRAMGVAVFAGMIGVTVFGLFLTPVFYVVLMRLGLRPHPAPSSAPRGSDPGSHGAANATLAILLLMLIPTLESDAAVGPDYRRPTNAVPAAYQDADLGKWQQAKPADALPLGEWWRVFQDETLNELETQADAHNQDLKASLARIEQARAGARQARAEFLPSVSLDPSYNRTRYSPKAPLAFPLSHAPDTMQGSSAISR